MSPHSAAPVRPGGSSTISLPESGVPVPVPAAEHLLVDDEAVVSAPANGEFVHFENSPFALFQPYPPAGDQPTAIDKLVEGILDGEVFQTLLGVTG